MTLTIFQLDPAAKNAEDIKESRKKYCNEV